MRALKAYAKKNEIILSKQYIYIDEGISGKRADKRPEFMRMIATAKTKPNPFDVILVHKYDRFARSREDSVVYKSLLKKEAGIKVISITESIEDDKFSIILEAMLEAMAEYYSLNLAEEVKKGMTEKALRGEVQTNPSYGYKIENGKLIVIPEEAEFVKFIFNKFCSREMGMRQLAMYANEIGIKTKKGKPFENRTIEYIINNPVYIGKLRWTPTGKSNRKYNSPDTIICDGGHEEIINIEAWNKAQEVIKEIKELYGKRQRSTTRVTTWLIGFIKCSNCGKTLTVNNKIYLQCSGYAKGTCKTSCSVKISVIEDLISEELRKTFTHKLEISIAPRSSETNITNEYVILQDTLKKLDQKEVRVKNAYHDGIDSLSEYKENKMKIENDRQKIIENLKTLKNSLTENIQDGNKTVRFENIYRLLSDETIPIDVKYKTAHFLINKVIYNKKEKLLIIEYK